MTRLLFRTLPVFILFSFTPGGEEKFDKAGISFTIPAEWKITDEEDLEGQGYYLACEKEGANSSGLVTVTTLNGKKDLEETATGYAEGLKENFTAKNAPPKMSAAKTASFNGIPCQQIDYSMTLISIPHEGRIYSFYCGNKTVTVLVQEAVEDKNVNKPGIEKIISSFSCK
jgi:hypothetical protein